MRVFLVGGTGFVGGHLRKELVARGHQVRVLVHHRCEKPEPGTEQVLGDVTDLSTFAKDMAGCDATINLVGIIREFPERGVTFERLHVEATRNIIAAAREAGIRRHLQMSALGTGPDTDSGYFQSKYRAEVAVRDSGLHYTIFRPSIIFGPKDEFVNKLASYLRLYPAMPVIGDGEYQLQPISGHDVARCFAMALDMPETVGKTYELCGPDRMTYNELLDTMGRVLGKRHVLKVKNPLFLMRLVVPFLQHFPQFPITEDQLKMLVQGNVCDGTWRKTFAFDPIPFETGIRQYLAR
ncbi:complex I NDUFA9 subunit family protein [Geomonas sp. RF6]|uniref:complex I NDUFA9 subunit family protein n=1 Tax=Geomonas sp. RF6 TaxID=2897342 RepID=UPI001E57B6E7|nr:complex I NDUFA9 subunit family protein [Geomonas sp. RF6]UFS71778.1 complex I NDUFA9 subunit family protein [Geomonas sp. RF6]